MRSQSADVRGNHAVAWGVTLHAACCENIENVKPKLLLPQLKNGMPFHGYVWLMPVIAGGTRRLLHILSRLRCPRGVRWMS